MVINMSRPARTTLTAIQKDVLDLWEKGLTSSAIGIQLHMTRNTVMGLVNRLRLRGFLDFRMSAKTREAMAKPKFKTKQQRLPIVIPVKIKPAPEIQYGPSVSDLILKNILPKPPKNSIGISLTALKSKSCKYPINNSATSSGHLFCGEPRKELSSYCAEHHAICYVPRSKSPKSLKIVIKRSKYDHRT
jgi:hypothetical protein